MIDFGDMSEDEARKGWPDLMSIVELKVKPERMKTTGSYKTKWWQFGRRSMAGTQATAGLDRFLVTGCGASPHLVFAFMPPGRVLANSLDLFPVSTYAAFCALQSRPHEIWTRFFASTLEDRLRYTPSDCFETFPFADNWREHAALESAGKAYYEFRGALMVRDNQGPTNIYNRFNDPDEGEPDILKLRELHTAMDRSVLDAYGWGDINPECEFVPEFGDEEDADENDRPKKKKYRLRWPDDIRDGILAKLLELNRQLALREGQLVSDDAATYTGGKPKKTIAKKSKPRTVEPTATPTLFAKGCR